MKRKGKRFKEKRKDTTRQISVTFIQQFYPSKTYIGKLYDLSENAIKVIIEKKFIDELLNYTPKTTLTKFRFSEKHKVTVTITSIKRVDSISKSKDKVGIVLFFDVMSKEDKENIKEIVNLYS